MSEMDFGVSINYNTTYQTPFKLPLWSEWTVQVKRNNPSACSKCCSVTLSLKELTIQALFRFLRKKKILHKLPQVLEDYFFPPVLYVDVARQLFAHKHWTVLGHLVSHWPFRSFSLSQIFCVNCPNCWSAYLESEDVEDSEREGGDTERQLLRKVFKHVLDGFFLVVKKKFNSGHSTPLRVLDLTLDPSQHVRGFMWEEEFRRLSRRVTKYLDVCVLAGLHKLARKQELRDKAATRNATDDQVIDHWSPFSAAAHTGDPSIQQQEEQPIESVGGFEISTWSDYPPTPVSTHGSPPDQRQTSQSPEIGVWNGDAIDLSHLGSIPLFSVVVDVAISEKSSDILMWMRQRYDDFHPATSPVTIQVRFLEVSMHEEGKFGSLAQRLPDEVHGFKLAEICERRSAKTLADLLPRFHWVRYLDLGSCAFDLTDDDRTLRLLREALGHLTLLERLSLAHNCIGDALETLLSGLERGLKLLDLSSCSLSHTDLTYLADSIHSQSLGSLSLASNELGLQWDVVVSLTHKMSSNLHILDLSSNEFVESQMMALTRMVATSPLSSLALLDLSWHPLKLSTLLDMIQLLSSKTSLRTFCLSTPVDMADAGYSELDSWQVFIDFTSQFATKHRPNRTPLMLHWCLM